MPSKDRLVIATRGSALALAQAHLMLNACRAASPDCEFELRVVKTTGDKLQAESSAEVDLPKGLFTKELEVALFEGAADLAVHSLKDLPTDLPEGLALGAVTTREDVRDVLIYRSAAGVMYERIADLPRGFVAATSSPRRQSQIQSRNAGVQTEAIRGNVPTRLQKLASRRDIGGLILAAAGLRRLGYTLGPDGELVGDDVPPGLRLLFLSVDEILPCVGQGALGIEVRASDARTKEICRALNHTETESCALAERAFLRAMGGGCQTPVAALGEISGDHMRFRAVSFESEHPRHADLHGPQNQFEKLGLDAAAILKRI